MKILAGLAILILLLLGLTVALPFLIDLNQYQDRYRPLIEDALNRKVTLQDIRLTIWPRIGARVRGFTVQDDPSFRSGPFASLSSLDVGVKLWPLLRGRVEVEEITLRDPVIVVFKSQAGVVNVSTLGSQVPPVEKPEAPPKEPPGGPLRALALLAVERVSIVGGQLTYQDASQRLPTEYAIRDLEFLLTDVHLGDTPRLHLAARVLPYNVPVRVEGSFGPLTETLDVQRFGFDVRLGAMPLSIKGAAIAGALDVAVNAPLIDTAEIPAPLPLTKPIQVRDFHATAHVDYGPGSKPDMVRNVQVQDLGFALLMGESTVNVKATAANGIAHLTAASANVHTTDLPLALPLAKPAEIRNLHLSARAPYPPPQAASPFDLADVTDFGATVIMGDSSADVQATLLAGVATATVVSKGLNTADLPIVLPLQGPVQVNGLHLAAEARAQEAQLKTLAFEVFKGSVKAQGTMGIRQPSPPFRTRITVEGLQLNPMMTAMGYRQVEVSGTAAANLTLSGRGLTASDLEKTLEGTGKLAVKQGKIEGLNLMKEVGALLKIAGLSPDAVKASVFSTIESDFVIKDGVVHADRLLLDSHDYQASGNGTVGLDHTIDARLRLVLSRALSQRAAASSPVARAALSGGRLSLPLLITGTLDAPVYRLDTKVFAGKIQEQGKKKVKEAVEGLLERSGESEDVKRRGKELLKGLFGR